MWVENTWILLSRFTIRELVGSLNFAKEWTTFGHSIFGNRITDCPQLNILCARGNRQDHETGNLHWKSLPHFIRYINFTFPFPQKIYATAVYDNIADSTEELAFRRGDILEVLERDTNGMVGWWLCLLRGRKVISTDDDDAIRRDEALLCSNAL